MLLDYGADVHDDDVSVAGAADITNSAMQAFEATNPS